jgi:hypothetical protein
MTREELLTLADELVKQQAATLGLNGKTRISIDLVARCEAALRGVAQPLRLRPMKEAPKDREIFAIFTLADRKQPDLGNFHPIQWIETPWDEKSVPHWGMRWHSEFRATLSDYVGWIDPADICALTSAD